MLQNLKASNYNHFMTFHESVGQEFGHNLVDLKYPRQYLHIFSALAHMILFTLFKKFFDLLLIIVFASCGLSQRVNRSPYGASGIPKIYNDRAQTLIRFRTRKGTGAICESSYHKDRKKSSDIWYLLNAACKYNG